MIPWYVFWLVGIAAAMAGTGLFVHHKDKTRARRALCVCNGIGAAFCTLSLLTSESPWARLLGGGFELIAVLFYFYIWQTSGKIRKSKAKRSLSAEAKEVQNFAQTSETESKQVTRRR